MLEEVLMEKIKLPRETKEFIKQYRIADAEMQTWKKLFYEEEQLFFDRLDAKEEKAQFVLFSM